MERERFGERVGNGERENLKRKRAESPIAEGSGEGKRLNEKTTNGEALNRNRAEDPMAEVSVGEKSTEGEKFDEKMTNGVHGNGIHVNGLQTNGVNH